MAGPEERIGDSMSKLGGVERVGGGKPKAGGGEVVGMASPGQREGRAMRVWKAICIRDFLNSHSHCK